MRCKRIQTVFMAWSNIEDHCCVIVDSIVKVVEKQEVLFCQVV
jgi:hypothetical protein